MTDNLRAIAENIVEHLEVLNSHLPAKAHGERLAEIEVIASVLLESLTHQGYVQVTLPNGRVVGAAQQP